MEKYKNSPRKTAIKLTFGLAGRPELVFLLSLLRGQLKEKKETKPCECNFFPIMSVSTTYSCSSTHHHGGARGGEGFVKLMFSCKYFAYWYTSRPPLAWWCTALVG